MTLTDMHGEIAHPTGTESCITPTLDAMSLCKTIDVVR